MAKLPVMLVKAADPLDIAVVWVEKARSGSVQWVDQCSIRQLAFYRVKKRLKLVTEAVKYFLLVQAMFEYPSWCLYNTDNCPSDANPSLYGSGAPVMPLQVSTSVNIVVLVYLLGYTILRKASLGQAHIVSSNMLGYLHGWRALGSLCVVVALVDDIFALFNKGGFLPGSFRISRLLRPLIFLCFTCSVRNAAARVARSIKGFVDVLIALAINLFFFVWAGLMLFHEKGNDPTHFPNWSDAFTNLWILFTTANCPDAFVTIYTNHRLAIIYFFLYLVISLYLLNNILLARVYDAYKEELKQMVITWAENEGTAINHAFELLKNDNGVIDRERWETFFKRYFASTYSFGHEDYNSKRAMAIFDLLDKDHTQGIDKSEFKSILDVLHNDEVYIPATRPPTWKLLRELHSLFTSGVKVCGRQLEWDTLIDGVIFVGVLLAFIQTILFINGGNSQPHLLQFRSPWFMILFIFTCFYVVELLIKMSIMGLERFWYTSPFMNRFDLINVFGLFITEIVCLHYAASEVGPQLTVLLHIARSLRLLRHVEPLNFIARMSVRIAPAYFRQGVLLFLIYYTYATVGIQCFGGMIYKGNPALTGTSFAGANYYPFNFNDFNSGMVTLFVLQVVNNWFVFAGAFIGVSGTKWTALFFLSFFVITNLVVLNILIAMILDCSAKILSEDADDDRYAYSSKDTFVGMIRRALLDIDEGPAKPADKPSRSTGFLEGITTAPSYGATGGSSV